jgi:hypothetical protein
MLTGSSSIDSLTGLNAPSTWNVAGSSTTYTSSGQTLMMSSIETFNGGSYEDRFIFADGATLPGSLDGSGGNDTLDFSAYTTGIWVDLGNGDISDIYTWAPLIAGGISSVENFRAGSGNDYLIGNSKANVLDGGAGDDYIFGGAGNDHLYSGSGYNYLDGGDGFDTGYIAYGSTYEAWSIENLIFLLPPPPPTPVTPIVQKHDARGTLLLGLWIIPVESGEWTDLICVWCSGIGLLLPNHNLVIYGLISLADASLTDLPMASLPGSLKPEMKFVSAMHVMLKINGQDIAKAPHLLRLSFVIPNELRQCKLAILFWDQTLNNGAGGWVEIPSWRVSAWLSDGLERIEANVAQTGIFVLVCVN